MSVQSTPTQSPKMKDDVFQRFCHSIAPGTFPDAVLDEWLTQDLARAGLLSPTEASTHSSPEVSTPHDVFLSSPTSVSIKEEPVQSPPALPTSCFFGDLAPLPTAAISPALITLPLPTAMIAPSALTHSNATVDSSPVAKTAKNRASTSSSDEMSTVDEILKKRQKNTDAARRSRLKKVQKMEALEKRVAELEKVNTSLLFRAAILESEKSNLKQKETAQTVRIELLEAQLTDAHKSIASLPTKS